ncbi:Hypothetical_protein [Hexamita inflata]|uniref:Hypothetical_protein n=1 Tax=Hexamita inflata TaxID=28002 RepID=A0AA86TPV3_9EUKA|nr:Hypothetical protein HINF_LOCUS11836 [Hexamita inflata]CAI9947456.1 Hypothetical protein HINF_LOCUS35101 [Hexamita inflata]
MNLTQSSRVLQQIDLIITSNHYCIVNGYQIYILSPQSIFNQGNPGTICLRATAELSYGELLKSLFLASFPFQIIIIWLSLSTKLSEGNLFSFYSSLVIQKLLWRPNPSKCPKNKLQDMLIIN